MVLAGEFPHPAAFSLASLIAIAGECRFFPAYAELRGHLGAWWREHRPATVSLPNKPAPVVRKPKAAANKRATARPPIVANNGDGAAAVAGTRSCRGTRRWTDLADQQPSSANCARCLWPCTAGVFMPSVTASGRSRSVPAATAKPFCACGYSMDA
jgi:hypothetical protein